MPLSVDDYNNLIGYLQATGDGGQLSQRIADNVGKDPNSSTSQEYLKGAAKFGAQAARSGAWRDFTNQFTGPVADYAAAAKGDYSGVNRTMQKAHDDDYAKMYAQYLASHPATRTTDPSAPPGPDAVSGVGNLRRTEMAPDVKQRWLAMMAQESTAYPKPVPPADVVSGAARLGFRQDVQGRFAEEMAHRWTDAYTGADPRTPPRPQPPQPQQVASAGSPPQRQAPQDGLQSYLDAQGALGGFGPGTQGPTGNPAVVNPPDPQAALQQSAKAQQVGATAKSMMDTFGIPPLNALQLAAQLHGPFGQSSNF